MKAQYPTNTPTSMCNDENREGNMPDMEPTGEIILEHADSPSMSTFEERMQIVTNDHYKNSLTKSRDKPSTSADRNNNHTQGDSTLEDTEEDTTPAPKTKRRKVLERSNHVLHSDITGRREPKSKRK